MSCRSSTRTAATSRAKSRSGCAATRTCACAASRRARKRSELVRDKLAGSALVIPAGTRDALAAGRPARLLLYTDPVKFLERINVTLRVSRRATSSPTRNARGSSRSSTSNARKSERSSRI